MALPNVVALGVGPKIRRGEPTGEMAIRVFVSRKIEAEALAPKERIPRELDGYPTDVEVMSALEAKHPQHE